MLFRHVHFLDSLPNRVVGDLSQLLFDRRLRQHDCAANPTHEDEDYRRHQPIRRRWLGVPHFLKNFTRRGKDIYQSSGQ
jgi:hypothetical protein